jgi:hypothetical protein
MPGRIGATRRRLATQLRRSAHAARRRMRVCSGDPSHVVARALPVGTGK